MHGRGSGCLRWHSCGRRHSRRLVRHGTFIVGSTQELDAHVWPMAMVARRSQRAHVQLRRRQILDRWARRAPVRGLMAWARSLGRGRTRGSVTKSDACGGAGQQGQRPNEQNRNGKRAHALSPPFIRALRFGLVNPRSQPIPFPCFCAFPSFWCSSAPALHTQTHVGIPSVTLCCFFSVFAPVCTLYFSQWQPLIKKKSHQSFSEFPFLPYLFFFIFRLIASQITSFFCFLPFFARSLSCQSWPLCCTALFFSLKHFFMITLIFSLDHVVSIFHHSLLFYYNAKMLFVNLPHHH